MFFKKAMKIENFIFYCAVKCRTEYFIKHGNFKNQTKINIVANCDIRFSHFVANSQLLYVFRLNLSPVQKCVFLLLSPTFLPRDKSQHSLLLNTLHRNCLFLFLTLHFFVFYGLITQVRDNKLIGKSRSPIYFNLTSDFLGIPATQSSPLASDHFQTYYTTSGYGKCSGITNSAPL